jgi:hypothetical protein
MIEKVIEESEDEVISLQEAKLAVNITNNLKDNLLRSYISASRAMCEAFCRHTIVDKTIVIQMPLPKRIEDEFNLSTATIDPYNIAKKMKLPYPPIKSIEHIKLVKSNGEKTDFTDFTFDDVSSVVFWNLESSNISISEFRYIEVQFKVGWGDVKVPPAFKGAVLDTFVAMYDERGDMYGLPKKAEQLLKPYQDMESHA